jgi:hypothetical protein
MQTLWPDVVEFDEASSHISEATSMKETLEKLSMKYHILINVTCVVHVSNRVKEQLMRFVQL